MSDRPGQRLLGRAGRSAGGPAGRGFTLIELMVVIAILAILTTLIVSVSSYVRTKAMQDETQANMKIIMSAIMAFQDQDAKGSFPVSLAAHGGITEARLQSKNLFTLLNSVPQCRRILQNLPPKAIDLAGPYFVDSFGGASLDYYYPGPAGRPTLVSAGKDGDYSTDADNLSSND